MKNQTILNWNKGLLLISICLVIQAAHAEVHTVKKTDVCIPCGDFSNIQGAIDGSRDGDIIYVNSGTYYENVVIYKRLTLIGNDTGKGSPIVDGMGKVDAFQIISKDVRLEGFIAQNSGSPCIKIRAGIWYANFLHAALLRELNNRQVGCAGIFLGRTSNVTIRRSIVRDNDLGISLFEAYSNIIEDNVAMNNAGSGIYLNHASYNKISDNTFEEGQNSTPINLERSSDNNEITNNTVTNTYSPTIRTDDSAGNIIFLNNFLVKSPFIRMNNNSSISWVSPVPVDYQYHGQIFSARLGNFWDGYLGQDLNSDGIGDTPFQPAGDTSPLMGQWKGGVISSNAIPEESPVIQMSPVTQLFPKNGTILPSYLLFLAIGVVLLFSLSWYARGTIKSAFLSLNKKIATPRETPAHPEQKEMVNPSDQTKEKRLPVTTGVNEKTHHDVFISYSNVDKPIADAVCAHLEKNSIRCWVAPRDVLPGRNFLESIIDAIDQSRIMILIFSSSSNNSPHVIRELTRAVNREVIIIPFRIENIEPSKSMEYLISVPHWLDAITPPLEQHVEKLTEIVQFLLKQ